MMTISQANAADLTISQLKNRAYFIPSWEDQNRGEWVHLKNGEYARTDPDNPLEKQRFQHDDHGSCQQSHD